jgi:hypothetical protein
MKNYYIVNDDVEMGQSCIIDLVPAPEMGLAGWVLTRVHTTSKVRGKGLAKRAMALALADADEDHVSLWLEINPYGPMSYEQLAEWYIRLGFGWSARHDGLMVRRPQA